LEAANGISACAEITRRDVVDRIADLVAKSLVTADVDGAIVRYRLLETTRAYMLEKLTASGERNVIARRHAEYYRNLFQGAAVEAETRPATEWMATNGPDIDNLRGALDWAFSPSGDPSVGVALAIAAAPHRFPLSRMEESGGRAERALASLYPGTGDDVYLKMLVPAAHVVSPRFATRHVPETGAAWAKALELADALDEPDYWSPARPS
jgi:predicted ATPase